MNDGTTRRAGAAKTMLWAALLLMGSVAAGPAWAGAEDDAAAVKAFVEEAVALIEREGEKAFAGFRELDSRWFKGERYVFVWGLDGTRYVYPPEPRGEGRNMLGLRDVNGKPIGRWFVARADAPDTAGWVHYQWPRPGEIFPSWKSTYIARAQAPSGRIYVVGSGRYNMPLAPAFVVDLVDAAAQLLRERGRAAFQRLRDPGGEYRFMDTYVFVMTTDGVELVNPAFPSLEGRTLIDHRDAAGKPLVREMIERTDDGGSAWVDYYWARPGTAEQVPKSAYVRRVTVAGEPLIVGAGIYGSQAADNDER